ncbi:MAG: M48 family metallopeptidase [Alphaproteobacteria bacterium]|nr:M48 family metallopeptidase [Alphaproteobacteria bacterium]
MDTVGVFFDGKIAAERMVTIRRDGSSLTFSGPDTGVLTWTFAKMEAVAPHREGHALRLSSATDPGSRLIVDDAAFIAELLQRAPHLAGRVNPRKVGRAVLWFGGGMAALLVAGYLVLQSAPQFLAKALPEAWRERVGAQIEASLTEQARQCMNPHGVSALAALTARITEGSPDLPPLAIRVYDIPVTNAFAMPGDRIVITAQLIARATRAEEVAGVLAHEIGHVINRHAEAQLIRATGLQLLIGLLTGGGGDTISSLAGLTAILRYSRNAESEADSFAVTAMTAAEIDTLGLRQFFETLIKEEGTPSTGTLGKIESVLASHPGTADRIRAIAPLPDGVVARQVLTESQWNALKSICD